MDPRRQTFIRYGVLAGLCVAATIAYISRLSINVPEKTIRGDLGLTLEEMSWVMSAFFITYALFQIPAAWLGQVMGMRRALTLYAVVWALATSALGLASGLWVLIVFRLVMGMAVAGLFPCSVNAISEWFPVARRALACGSLGCFMGLGGAAATMLSGALLGWLTWRQMFFVLGLPGIVLAFWFARWFRDRPEEHALVNSTELEVIRGPGGSPAAAGDKKREPVPWLRMITSRRLWWICGQQFFRASTVTFYMTWFPTFLQETQKVTTSTSGFLASLPLLGQVAGSLVGGVVVDAVWNRTGSRRLSRQGVAIFGLVSSAILLFAAFFTASGTFTMVFITGSAFLAAVAGPCGYTITIDMGGKHVPTVFGAMNMVGNLGAALCPLLVARIVDWTGNWNDPLLLFGTISLLAAGCWGMLDPEGAILEEKSQKEYS